MKNEERSQLFLTCGVIALPIGVWVNADFGSAMILLGVEFLVLSVIYCVRSTGDKDTKNGGQSSSDKCL